MTGRGSGQDWLDLARSLAMPVLVAACLIALTIIHFTYGGSR